jgi:hypothetical protein
MDDKEINMSKLEANKNEFEIENFDIDSLYAIHALTKKERRFVETALRIIRNQMVFSLATKADYSMSEEEAIGYFDKYFSKVLNGEMVTG